MGVDIIESKELQSFRKEVATLFDKSVWPTLQDEEWRRSDPQTIPFDMLDNIVSDIDMSEETIQAYREFQHSLEDGVAKHSGLQFIPWDSAEASIAVPVLNKTLESALDRIDTWRMTNFHSGGIIVVPKGTVIDEPIGLCLHGMSTDSVLAPQVVVIVEDNASIAVDIKVTGDGFFAMGLYSTVADHGTFHINQLQNTSIDSFVINSTFSDCGEEAKFTNTSGQLGGMVAVDRVYASTLGTLSNIHINGYYFPIEDQLVDMRTYQRHLVEDSNSRALYHGVAVDQSHSVYRGLIQVGDDAIETDAYLTNNNLLLSDEARMDSIPCLNIKTNDVRCSHGSTTGTINPDHIFYLQTRGLSDTDAKELILDGFFQVTYDTVFEQSNEEAREIIRERIKKSI